MGLMLTKEPSLKSVHGALMCCRFAYQHVRQRLRSLHLDAGRACPATQPEGASALSTPDRRRSASGHLTHRPPLGCRQGALPPEPRARNFRVPRHPRPRSLAPRPPRQGFRAPTPSASAIPRWSGSRGPTPAPRFSAPDLIAYRSSRRSKATTSDQGGAQPARRLSAIL